MRTFLILLSFLFCHQLAFAKKDGIAIFPFKNNALKEHQWLSGALSDALITKLHQPKNLWLIERKHIKPLIESLDKSMLKAEQFQHIGLKYLIIGSYSILDSTIEIHARIIQAETSEILKDSSVKVRGSLNQILELETELATKLALSCAFTIEQQQLRTSESKNYQSHRLYYLGKDEYENKQYQLAIELFIKAQAKNDGLYFSEAHHLEGLARLALAKEKKGEAKKKILKNHIKKFEKDAHQAAPAFYNLGIAYQANQQHTKAIQSFNHYLKWYDKEARPFRWAASRKANDAHIVKTEDAPYFYEHGKREREQDQFAIARFSYNFRYWIIDETFIYFIIQDEIVCRRLSDGKFFWAKKLPPLQRVKHNSREPQYANFLIKRDNTLYFSNMSSIHLFDARNGKTIQSIKTSLTEKTLGHFYVFDQDNTMLIHYEDKEGRGYILAYDIANQSLKWKKEHPFSVVNAYKKGFFYTTSKNARNLIQIKIQTGEKRIIHTFQEAIYQVWPNEEQLLIRTSDNPRLYDNDQYFIYHFSNKTIKPPENKIFFSTFYNWLPPDIQSKKVPLMDANTGYYQLVPASYFYPRNILRFMDATDKQSLSTDLTLPWYRLKGKLMFGWTPDKMIRGYDLNNNNLLWSKTLKDSKSTCDFNKKYIISKDPRGHLQVYSRQSSPDVERYVSAFLKKSISLSHLDRMNLAISTLETGLKNAHEDVASNLFMAELHRKMGNTNETIQQYKLVLEYAAKTSQSYKKAKNYLSKKFGLFEILPYNARMGNALYEDTLYFSYNKNEGEFALGTYNLQTEKIKLNYLKEQLFSWRFEKPYIYYYDLNKNFYRIHLDTKKKDHLFHEPENIVQDDWNLVSYHGQNNTFDILGNSALYAAKKGTHKKIICRDLTSGKIKWLYPFNDKVSISYLNNMLVIGHYKSFQNKSCRGKGLNSKGHSTLVKRLDPEDGSIIWERVFKTELTNNGCVAFIANNRLKISFIQPTTCCRQDKMYPKNPYYTVDQNTGLVLSKVNYPFYNHKLFIHKGIVALYQYQHWNWEYPVISFTIPSKHWQDVEDFKIYEADITDPHPKRLAELKELEPYKNEFDLKHHIGALNNIIETPDLRKKFISDHIKRLQVKGKRKKPVIHFPNIGYQALPHLLKRTLEQETLSERDEKYATRQLMSIWKGREQFSPIRSFRFPTGPRLDNTIACVGDDKNQYAVGAYRGRILIADMDQQSKLLARWKTMPGLHYDVRYYYPIYNLVQHKDYLAVHSETGYQIYNFKTLIHFTKHNLKTENGCFTVDSISQNLSHLVDEHSDTYGSIQGEERCIVGIDHGHASQFKGLSITPVQGSAELLHGAFIQSSTHSETGQFRNVGSIKINLKENESNTIPLNTQSKARYWRIVTKRGGTLKLANLQFTN